MTIALGDLVAELRIHAPHGIELPRDPDTSEVSESTVRRWAEDAAQAINERRHSAGSLLETTITLVADTVDYALPAGCRRVSGIDRQHATVQSSTVLGIPTQAYDFMFGPFGTLPSGQEVTPALDAINRQRLAIVEDEDAYEVIGGKIRFLFPIEAGEVVKVRYSGVDRDYASVGDDRFTMLLTYLRVQAIDWWLGKFGASITGNGDSFGADTAPSLYRLKAELEAKWTTGLNSIGPEAS